MSPDLRAKTLFTVESTGPFIHAHQNARFRVCEELHFPRDEHASRSSTPAEEESSTPVPEVKTKTYLGFTVDNIGDQTSFVFGSERETCDIHVYAARKISRRIFAVELEKHGHIAMLKNLSTHGIDIESPIYERQRFRRKRALHPGDKVTIFLPGFNIEVRFLNHSDHAALHELYLQELRPKFEQAVPGINQLGLESIPESSARSQGKSPYQLYDEIGSGAFGTVYRAVHSYTGAFVAIKRFHKRQLQLPSEVKVLESLFHSNIVRFIEYISPRGEPPMLVMELLDFPNLEEAHREKPFPVDDTRDLLSELLCGVDYLHSEDITHRDLKPTNIIVVKREPMVIKITDFGLAKRSDILLKTFCGTHLYVAPEVYTGAYSNQADMWSVGVIALELGGGLPNYPKDPKKRKDWPGLLIERVETTLLPPLFYFFVKSLLHPNAGQRPSARESRRHQFLQVESHFIDALPTEYSPTPPEYRDEYVRPFDSPFRSNAPSPWDHAAGGTQIFAPLLDHQAPAPELVQTVPTRASDTVYSKLKYAGATVMYRPDDGLVNVTQLLKAIRHKRTGTWASLEARIGNMHRSVVVGNRKRDGVYVQGSYVPITDAKRILLHLGLPTASLQVLIEQIDGQG